MKYRLTMPFHKSGSGGYQAIVAEVAVAATRIVFSTGAEGAALY